MKANTGTADTPFARFTKAMDGLMAVPHSEVKKLLDKEKRQKARRKRPTASRKASGHASSGRG